MNEQSMIAGQFMDDEQSMIVEPGSPRTDDEQSMNGQSMINSPPTDNRTPTTPPRTDIPSLQVSRQPWKPYRILGYQLDG